MVVLVGIVTVVVVAYQGAFLFPSLIGPPQRRRRRVNTTANRIPPPPPVFRPSRIEPPAVFFFFSFSFGPSRFRHVCWTTAVAASSSSSRVQSWRQAYQKQVKETEVLKREGGDTALAAQWRQRYEKLSLEKVHDLTLKWVDTIWLGNGFTIWLGKRYTVFLGNGYTILARTKVHGLAWKLHTT